MMSEKDTMGSTEQRLSYCLKSLKNEFTGVSWFIEGRLKAFTFWRRMGLFSLCSVKYNTKNDNFN